MTRWVLAALVLFAGCKKDPDEIDEDGDGVFADEDCDDTDPGIRPGVNEIVYDGIDNDCDPSTVDDDLDGDGFLAAEECDDRNPDIRPDQVETPYDGFDNDCDPSTVDDDLDGDGFGIASDCADGNADINPDQDEIYYDGLDNDCDPLQTVDDDQDRDQVSADIDCDDLDPLAREPGLYYVDCDADGFAADANGATASCTLPAPPDAVCPGGSWTLLEPVGPANDAANDSVDCSDTDPAAFPGQTATFDTPVIDGAVGFAFDFDCNGAEEGLYDQFSCAMNPGPVPDTFFCTHLPGFLVDPGCGLEGDYASGCVEIDSATCEEGQTEPRTQECR